jgi:hypothetical protein
LLNYVGHHAPTLFDDLANAKGLEDAHVEQLERVVAEFKQQFGPTVAE